MKNTLLTFIPLIIGLSLIGVYWTNNHPVNNKTEKATSSTTHQTLSSLEKHHLPNEHFFWQRAYPDFNMSVDVVKNALREAQQQSNAKQSDNDATWLLEGPTNIGGRINAIAVHPNNPNIIYAGSARGGVHKTTDGGNTWLPIFDEQLFNSIGDIVIAPHNPQTIYVGTGDLNISSHFSVGNGIYRSNDAGETWQNIGLSEVGIIAKIIVNPTDSNQIFVATMGNPIARDENRGLYKTNDGGATWQKILYIDDDAGIIDMVMSPNQPNTLYAASWNRIRNMQETIINEQDSKIWKSTDGGETWAQLSNGLPDNLQSRIGLAIATQNPNRLAAIYVDSTSAFLGVYISNDAGETWTQTADLSAFNFDDPLAGFGWYFGKIYFSPQNDQQLFLLGVDMFQSTDGGFTWEICVPYWWQYEVHADKHAMAFDNNGGILLGTDGGMYRSDDNTETWQDIEFIPNTQFYRIAVNPHIPNTYCGGAQDNGTTMGNADIISEWPRIFGGDGFQPTFHPTDPNLFYAEMQNGAMIYSNDGGNNFDSANEGIDPSDRRNWDMPYIISPHADNGLYAGTYRLYKSTTNDPPFFLPISEDLTDGVIYGNNFHNITTIDQSILSPNYLYVGTSDGNVWRSLNDGNTWESINQDLPDRYVTSVKASPHQLNTVYVSISGYKGNGTQPHIFKSDNNGTNWSDISGNLPPIAVNDILLLPEDTTEQIILAATDAGVYMSVNAGTTWQRLGNNMPFFSVFDIDYDPNNHKLVAATFARSIMSFDLSQLIDFSGNNPILDITPNPAQHSNAIALNAQYNYFDQSIAVTIQHSNTMPNPIAANIALFDLNGKIINRQTMNDLTTNIAFSTQQLSKGIYIVALQIGNKQYTQKISVM